MSDQPFTPYCTGSQTEAIDSDGSEGRCPRCGQHFDVLSARTGKIPTHARESDSRKA